MRCEVSWRRLCTLLQLAVAVAVALTDLVHLTSTTTMRPIESISPKKYLVDWTRRASPTTLVFTQMLPSLSHTRGIVTLDTSPGSEEVLPL
jgi:hypothetical protein